MYCAWRRSRCLKMHSRGPDRRLVESGTLPPGVVADRRGKPDRRRNGFISNLQLFFGIPYDVVETVLDCCPVTNVEAGAVLLSPGQHNQALHLLVGGRLRIHLGSVDSPDYIPIEEGGCFGELSIIDGRPVSAYVVADRPSRVMTIHDSVFWERLVSYPGVARNLLKVLSERMRSNGEMILARMRDKLALEHLQKELSIAADIQKSMVPDGNNLFEGHPGVRAWGIMEAAKNVGGDFYDAFALAPNRLFLAIGDVSGKGVPAALFMARTITQIRMEALRGRSLGRLMSAVNDGLCQGNDAGMFVTLFCAMLDLGTGTLKFANAGHNPPVLVPAGGPGRFLDVHRGLVAGIMEGQRYPVQQTRLDGGDCLLLYTDGVTEALNLRDEAYSEERMLAVADGPGLREPRRLIEAIRGSIEAFVAGAPQADDITMLAVSRSAGPESGRL